MVIKARDFYKSVYNVLGEVTPLETDCGKLCGAACCKSSDAGEGMYLYPGEDKYICFEGWGTVQKSDFFSAGRKTPFITCRGKCERTMRPLACRIFPLVPYITKNGQKSVIIDPRGAILCPLKNVDAKFYERTAAVCALLWKVREIKEFIYDQSRLIDDSIMPFAPEWFKA